MKDAIDNLTYWTRPENYGGANPEGFIVVATRYRDSSILRESNFETAQKRIADVLGHDIEEVCELRDGSHAFPVFSIMRTGHWAVGWVEYLLLAPNAPERAIDEARSIARNLDDYSVLDADDYSRREWDAAIESWTQGSLRERIELCAQFDVSIYAARRSELPEVEDPSELLRTLIGES